MPISSYGSPFFQALDRSLSLELIGALLLGVGAFHLVRTELVFDFYRRFNEGKKWFQFQGGASPTGSRHVGLGYVAVGIVALIAAFTS
jgi:hypothetical protein